MCHLELTQKLFRVKTKKSLQFEKLSSGPKQLVNFLILLVSTGEGIGPAGEISPVVCMLKNGLLLLT